MNELTVTKSRTFVNVLPRDIDKYAGLKWLLDEVGLPPKVCLGIGDGQDDLPFLKACGASAAPSNAAETVKKAVNCCSPHSFGAGLIDCARHFL